MTELLGGTATGCPPSARGAGPTAAEHVEGGADVAAVSVASPKRSSACIRPSSSAPAAPRKGIDDVEFATLDGVTGSTKDAHLEPIGDVPPAEFEAYNRREVPTYTPGLKELSLR